MDKCQKNQNRKVKCRELYVNKRMLKLKVKNQKNNVKNETLMNECQKLKVKRMSKIRSQKQNVEQ